jgi:predicted CXXCH cytochrome family protein
MLVAAAALLTVVSCNVFRAFWPSEGPAPRPFNHEAHTVRGIGCLDCHETAGSEVRAGMPTKAFCMTCHEDLDKDPAKPLEKRVAWFLGSDGEPRWSAFGRQSSEIRFSHGAHAAKKVECLTCHAGMDKDTGLLPGLVQRMGSCTSCHAEQAPAKNDCAACHVSLDRSTPPGNHEGAWDRLHGLCSRLGTEAASANHCALCHTKDSCTACHQTRPPADHNEAWRHRSHGIAAGIDRSRCATCHATDSCARCHQSAAPASHGPGWNAPRNRHCVSCHEPVQRSGNCAVCHSSTPGHATAPPKPAWHTPALDCRGCHSASLKHPDNGDDCNRCHK